MRLCIYVLSYRLSYVLSYPFHFLSLHKSLVYPAFVYILYNECSEDMSGEYSSAKNQWNNWGGTLGAIAPFWEKSHHFQKEYKKEVFHLVLPHFDFWLAIEKCYYVPILRGCQIIQNESFKGNICLIAMSLQ